MIKSTCDRCGKERGYQHQNEIDSLDFQTRKTAKEQRAVPNDSRGTPDDSWRFRICPIHSSLCRECLLSIIKERNYACGGWAHEGDYEPEAYNLVQSPVEAKVPRFKDHAEWQIATGNRMPTMSLIIHWAMRVVTTEEEATKPWGNEPWRPVGF